MSQKKGENRRRGGQEALAGREIPHGGNISHTERGSLRGQTLDTFIHEARGGVGSTGWVCDAEYATVWPVFRE